MVVSICSASNQFSFAICVVSVARPKSNCAISEGIDSIELNVLILSTTVGSNAYRIGIVITNIKRRILSSDSLRILTREGVQKSEATTINTSDREIEVSFSLKIRSHQNNKQQRVTFLQSQSSIRYESIHWW